MANGEVLVLGDISRSPLYPLFFPPCRSVCYIIVTGLRVQSDSECPLVHYILYILLRQSMKHCYEEENEKNGTFNISN